MRHPTASTNSAVYNDLALLEEQLEVNAVDVAKRAAEEAARPMPKTVEFNQRWGLEVSSDFMNPPCECVSVCVLDEGYYPARLRRVQPRQRPR